MKFTAENGRVEVALSQNESAQSRTAEITVRDNGVGIAPEFLPYVFDHFKQADGSSTRQFGGLGLGLAIARHLAELQGGTVRAESEGERQGATFVVALPLVESAISEQFSGLEKQPANKEE
ncbi:ATP-binding protein [Leptolyngbya sp. DQ-M1]|uniref:sensor histidine kinase n=1 Tax=Leptolyngbya sp. DQ-M1 TaxID=2933920 RepID=UPI003298DEC1